MELLPCVELGHNPEPSASILWLHGLGADGYDFVPIARTLNLGDGVRFVFPHAPERPVTLNGGHVMRAWYDVLSPDLTDQQDENGIRAAQRQVEQLIARERERGIPANRILLAGFSQGGAMALHAGLRQQTALGGIIALSAYLPLEQTLDQESTTSARTTPVFMAHGTQDPIIPWSAAEHAAHFLTARRISVTWRSYAMAHAVCEEEILEVRSFIRATLGVECAGTGNGNFPAESHRS